jgi:hypothetical protein
MKNILTTLIGLSLLSAANASGISETAIQTSSRSGGSLTELQLRTGQNFYFSMTAASTDIVTLTTSTGLSFSFPLGTLAVSNDPRMPWVLDRAPERLPDGRLRLFCRINANKVPLVNTGATLRISRGAANIDTDRIVKR